MHRALALGRCHFNAIHQDVTEVANTAKDDAIIDGEISKQQFSLIL